MKTPKEKAIKWVIAFKDRKGFNLIEGAIDIAIEEIRKEFKKEFNQQADNWRVLHNGAIKSEQERIIKLFKEDILYDGKDIKQKIKEIN